MPRILWWARRAAEEQRVQAVEALARALVLGRLSPEDRDEVEMALIAMLDDPAPRVRQAIAEAVAPCAHAPRPLVDALLRDRGEIAAPVLEHSPLLSDSELVDHVALRDDSGRTAIARRRTISPAVAGALSEIGALSVVTALLDNAGARIAGCSLKRIVARFGREPAVRDALLRRPDLPIEVRMSLAAALSRRLSDRAAATGGANTEHLAESAREACERALVGMALLADARLTRRIVVHLRASGLLTPSLITRAALSGGLRFCEAAFAELSGVAPDQVAALLPREAPEREALYDRTGLPQDLKPPLLAVISALSRRPVEATGLSRCLIERALAACADRGSEPVRRRLARYADEVTREAARLARPVTSDGLAQRERRLAPALPSDGLASLTRSRPAADRPLRKTALEQAA